MRLVKTGQKHLVSKLEQLLKTLLPFILNGPLNDLTLEILLLLVGQNGQQSISVSYVSYTSKEE